MAHCKGRETEAEVAKREFEVSFEARIKFPILVNMAPLYYYPYPCQWRDPCSSMRLKCSFDEQALKG